MRSNRCGKTYCIRYRNFLKSVTGIILFLFICRDSDAQIDPVMDTITQVYRNYAGYVLEEKLYVHTDKSGYIAGELMWFKIYAVDGRRNRPLALSKVAYIELLDNKNKSVLQTKIAMDSGRGEGAVIIPITLSSGNYRLRSYTHWMKNFSELSFFTKVITVINGRKTFPAVPHPLPPIFNVQFFPEGGNLVSELESKVAFKIADQYGTGVAGKGWILDEQEDTVIRFHPQVFGMGHFMFTPKIGKSYSAFVRLPDGKIIRAGLGAVHPEGVVMRISSNEKNILTITVRSNKRQAGQVYLIIHTRLSVKVARAANLINGETIFSVAEELLGEGISTITVFDAAKQPVCERLFLKLLRQ